MDLPAELSEYKLDERPTLGNGTNPYVPRLTLAPLVFGAPAIIEARNN